MLEHDNNDEVDKLIHQFAEFNVHPKLPSLELNTGLSTFPISCKGFHKPRERMSLER